MAARTTSLSGIEWQDWANRLLSCHYGPTEYQRVEDKDRGDAGIEGFTITEGHAYQAYGCEEPLSTSARYGNQRDKMTEDVRKFIENRKILCRIFGKVKIERWVLLVPFWDSKELVSHASKKTAEVIEKKLPYVSSKFRVIVCQEDDFSIARDKLISVTPDFIKISAENATQEQVEEWATANDKLTTVLTDKLTRLPTLKSESSRSEFRDKVLKWYLEGQAILDALRKYPEVHEKTLQTKSHREKYLALASASGTSAQKTLANSIEALRDAIRNEVKELHSFSAESLAFEAAADWLIRCPLDFPEVETDA